MLLFDSDYALIGTGVAPLVAAAHLANLGKSVLVLNPDFDFFLEDSELPLDPLLPPSGVNPARIRRGSPEVALEELRGEFPGAVEYWAAPRDAAAKDEFHDGTAPHVRQRGRLWLDAGDSEGSSSVPSRARAWSWEALEALYVEAEDAGLKPQILEGLSAARRFPGFAGGRANHRALYLPRLADVDVHRYRAGLLEFVREKLGPDRVVPQALQIEPIPEGLRFHAGGVSRSARIREGILAFWTPRLSSWVLNQSKRAESRPLPPQGVRLWEQWSIVSRDPLDCAVVGSLGDLVVWTEVEGAPEEAQHRPGRPSRLAVLRAGPLNPIGAADPATAWVSGEAFQSLSQLCGDFLQWEKFSIRSLRPRAIFEWAPQAKPWSLIPGDPEPRIRIVPGADGPLVEVIRRAREACVSHLESGGASA